MMNLRNVQPSHTGKPEQIARCWMLLDSRRKHAITISKDPTVNRFKQLLLFSVLFLHSPIVPAAAAEIVDDFSKPDWKGRQALRGEWKFENNQASCVADPKLYKKFKNHGPILRWSLAKPFKDGTVKMEFQPKKCQRTVITLNNETGHVFRIALTDDVKAKTRIFGWAHPSKEKDKPAETLAQKGGAEDARYRQPMGQAATRHYRQRGQSGNR